MTTATTEGRRLVLTVEGIDQPFKIDPLAAKRGKYLTDRFVLTALGQLPMSDSEAIFIESINPTNYARLAGMYVDEFDANGRYLRTFDDKGERAPTPQFADERDLPEGGPRFIAREAIEAFGESEIEGEAIRQEEAELLALCAFYWQTVVGMEAVNVILSEGGGTAGSLKALSLLQIRLGLSPTPTSRSSAMESEIQRQAGSSPTTDTPNSSGSVRVPADYRPPRNPAAGRRRHKRK